jgi:hypothetical protein
MSEQLYISRQDNCRQEVALVARVKLTPQVKFAALGFMSLMQLPIFLLYFTPWTKFPLPFEGA